MAEYKRIYQQQAKPYERLVSREDYQQNIFKATLAPLLKRKNVVELGAGIG